MNRTFILLLVLALPLGAAAQAFKCPDAATGRVLYTDQPCPGGETVVPARTPEQVAEDARRAEAARERAQQRREEALERERLQLEQAQAAEALRPPPSPADSQACREAREEARFRAASVTASEEQIRTARANAALACGQPAPPEIVVVRPPPVARWWPQRPYPQHPGQPPFVRPPQVRPPHVRPPYVRPPVIRPPLVQPRIMQPRIMQPRIMQPLPVPATGSWPLRQSFSTPE